MYKKPILYVILNGELKMSPGKGAAQAVHAAMMLETGASQLFKDKYERTVIILEAKNSETLRNLYEYLKTANIYSRYYIDERTEHGQPFQLTALAVDVFDSENEEKRAIFEAFPLFKGHVTVKYLNRFGVLKGKVKVSGGSTESGFVFRALKRKEK